MGTLVFVVVGVALLVAAVVIGTLFKRSWTLPTFKWARWIVYGSVIGVALLIVVRSFEWITPRTGDIVYILLMAALLVGMVFRK